MAEVSLPVGQQPVGVPTAEAQPSVRTYHVVRDMKFYSVTESELESITSFNGLVTFGFSAGSFVLALLMPDLLNIAVDAWLGKPLLPESMARFLVKCLVIGVLALVFFGLGIWGTRKKQSRWTKIGQESAQR